MNKLIQVLKKNLVAVAGVGLVAIAGFSTNFLTKKDVALVPIEESPIEEVVVAPKPIRKVPKVSTPTKLDSRTYSDLILAFKDSTLQFNSTCQVRMSTQVYKLGSEILLDNRSSFPMDIRIGTETFKLGSYGYKTIFLNNPGQFLVDCNNQQNVATINVQK
jgi:hypothetical protein